MIFFCLIGKIIQVSKYVYVSKSNTNDIYFVYYKVKYFKYESSSINTFVIYKD